MYRLSSIAVVLLSLAACRVALAESQDGEGASPHRRHHRHHHHHLHHQEAVPATQSLVATGAGDVASQAAAEQDAEAPSSQAPPVYQVVKAEPATVVKAPAGASVCICQPGMPPPPPTCQMTCPSSGAQGPICVCQPGMPTPPPPCDAQCPGPKVEVYVAHEGNESKAFAVEAPEEEADEANKPLPAPKGPYMDVDLEMPYGHLEPFGREDTAQELTEQSMMESDAMVDQLEKAEVAEEKRAVFRALTRLRGAAIASFDGIARSQTGNIDQYAKVNKWREAHPVHHLASEEADVYKWAFPDKSD